MVKSDAQVAINKMSDPVQKYLSLGYGWRDSAPNSNLSKLLEFSETCPNILVRLCDIAKAKSGNRVLTFTFYRYL